MDDSEKITGKKIFNILEQVKKNHTVIKIHVMGTGFDGLTVILGVSEGEHPRFFIDDPGRAGRAAPLAEGRKCYFEFSDDIRIKYRFKTTVDSVFGKRIKFRFPEFIERSQRRKMFRITVPSGTLLTGSVKGHKFELDTFNLSESGVLAGLKAAEHDTDIFFKGNTLRSLSLISNGEDGPVKIKINSVQVVRVEKVDENGIINYGIRITDIGKNEKNELKNFIYYCQRRVLQKRGVPDDLEINQT